jgi:hypothetical protein
MALKIETRKFKRIEIREIAINVTKGHKKRENANWNDFLHLSQKFLCYAKIVGKHWT